MGGSDDAVFALARTHMSHFRHTHLPDIGALPYPRETHKLCVFYVL
jgi:hypothetical protein